MAIKKRARGKRGNRKRRLATGSTEIRITAKQRRSVLDTLAGLQKDAKDLALNIEDIKKILCRVDFCR